MLSTLLTMASLLAADSLVLEPELVHLRSGSVREWSEFPEQPQARELERSFLATRNEREATLRLRQADVKQSWRVLLNDQKLGELTRDENAMVVYLRIPPGTLQNGTNRLKIAAASADDKSSDDIRVGDCRVEFRPPGEVLNEGRVSVQVRDGQTQAPLPCRLTIVDAEGALQTVGAESNDRLAVRPGTIYSAPGEVSFGVPAGRYTCYAGRGFEYSLAEATLEVAAGANVAHEFQLWREVPTPGYVACDTHIHTLTHSGHGDATLDERMITLAGEGIELPVATDHNVHIRYDAAAERLGLRRYFTPVGGNEVTTSVGHFNIFPVRQGARVPNHRLERWEDIFRVIRATPEVEVIILNHARDLHSQTRPFGPKLHNSLVGENLHGWPMAFNAMEVVNSGATQTDPLQLFRDWMALLNRGYAVTPVGSSDSHDVARHFVGQGRTYVACEDEDVADLDLQAAVRSFRDGRVMVSYGLLAELTVNGQYRSGDLAPAEGETTDVRVRVLGPAWVRAEEVQLYANGHHWRTERISRAQGAPPPSGIQAELNWKLPRPHHDQHLVAIALGAGVGVHWKTAKPYQPASPDWTPRTLGCSGAVWLDGDGNGQRTSAREYAERLAAGDLRQLLEELAAYDEAVAVQAAARWHRAGNDILSADVETALHSAPAFVQSGFRAYRDAWRETQSAP